MKKGDPGFVAYKITRNLSYGSMLLGVFSLIGGVLLFFIGSTFVFIGLVATFVILLGFAGLVVIMALYKLGEVTENQRIKYGFKLFGYGLLLAFFGAPALSFTGPISIYIINIVFVLTLFIPLSGWIYVLLGLVDYGKLEGSDYIVRYSFIGMILTILYPIVSVFLASIGDPSFAQPIIIINLILGSFSLLILFLLGLEFRRISTKVKKAIETLDINELKKEVDKVPFENLVNISKSRDIPYILLASIKTG